MILVAGAGGFIGGHLVKELLERGYPVKAVDVKPFDYWYQLFSEDAHSHIADLRDEFACQRMMKGVTQVYNLATDMGGIGYLESTRLRPMKSVTINTFLLSAAKSFEVERYFFSSSACVYGQGANTAVKETDAYPAHCEDGYGWEKLFSERMCRHYREEAGLETRVARYHNVYGPHGSYDGGREKAPAALCRKIAQAKQDGLGALSIWGDGTQERSFMHIDDCVTGTLQVMEGNSPEPVNLGSSELVSIDRLADIIEVIAGTKLQRFYEPDAPKGVRGRNSDNTMIQELYGWAPSIPLSVGLTGTYEWIAEKISAHSHA